MLSRVDKTIVYMNIMDDKALEAIKKHVRKGDDIQTEGLFVVLDMQYQIDRNIAFTFATSIADKEPELTNKILVAVTVNEEYGRRV